jgi:gamma-butyrobetaine dioxygenase
MKIHACEQREDHLLLNISGKLQRFHFLWLRDNGPDSRSPNGQRLHESNSIDPAVHPASLSFTDSALHIEWSDTADLSYPAEFLAAWVYDGDSAVTCKPDHWGTEVGDSIGAHDFAEVCSDKSARYAWLRDVERYGFSLLRDVPAAEKMIFDVVELFGFVRETNYGRLFDVRTEEAPSNLAYTPVPLSVHTDNPYRDPCPTLQLLHCLVQSDEGGDTALVDGFHAAARLLDEDPGAFQLLTGNDVQFRYESQDAIIETRCPIITLNSRGEPKRIRINNRSLMPLRLPFEDAMPFYEALFLFRQLLEDDRFHYRCRLQAGDLVLLDNERVLHGRVGQAVGERHLQGCYADRDGLLSTLRVLERNNE